MENRIVVTRVTGLIVAFVSGCGGVVVEAPPIAVQAPGVTVQAPGVVVQAQSVAVPAAPVPVVAGYQGVVRPIVSRRQVIHSANPALCIDVQGDNAAQHANIRLSRCHGRENQRWDFGLGTRGAVRVSGIGGLCISIMSGPAPGGSMTELLGCNGGPAEELRFFADGRIQELAGGRCLTAANTANDAPILLMACDPSNPFQVWTLSN